MRERPTSLRRGVARGSRAARRLAELKTAREVEETTSDREERHELWFGLTGKSEQTLHRRLEELSGYGTCAPET